MHMHIPAVLTAKQVADCAGALARAEWVDGRITAGHQSAQVKDNLQLSETDPTGRRLGDMILTALGRNPLFMSGALPVKVVPPLFNRYENSQAYGDHIDGAIHLAGGAAHRIRTDLSATLFLTAPEDYDGGELVIRGGLAAERIKLPAGDMILYPAATLHRVEPVTRGRRVCSFFWIQSMVREADRREILFDLDTAIQRLSGRGLTTPEQLSIVTLTGVYHNLLRQWAEV